MPPASVLVTNLLDSVRYIIPCVLRIIYVYRVYQGFRLNLGKKKLDDYFGVYEKYHF